MLTPKNIITKNLTSARLLCLSLSLAFMIYSLGAGLTVAAEPVQSPKTLSSKAPVPFVLETTSDALTITDDLRTLEEQAAAYPDNIEAQFLLAVAYSRTPHLEKALHTLQRTKKLIKRHPEKYAVIDGLMSDYEAMARYREADAMVYYRLGFGYYLKGYAIQKGYIVGEKDKPPLVSKPWYDKAEWAMRQTMSVNPKDIWAKNYLGYFLVEQAPEQNLDQATRLWEDSVQTDPVNPVAWVMLSQVAMKQGNLKKALACVNKGIQSGASESTRNSAILQPEK